jgi:hypothetical protein
MFDDLDSALRHVGNEAEEKLTRNLQVFEGKNIPWWKFW